MSLAAAKGAAAVLNWNQEQDSTECLASLRAVESVQLRVLLVDNGSAPDSVDRLARRFPEALVIRLPENRGFAAGNNVGIERALKEGATHILLLNNDTLVHPTFLIPLLEGLNEPSVGVVGPKIYYHPDVTRIWFAGGMIDWPTGRQWHLGANETDDGRWAVPRDEDYVTACCLLAPARMVQEIGGLDERHRPYVEEIDSNPWIRVTGYRCSVIPS